MEDNRASKQQKQETGVTWIELLIHATHTMILIALLERNIK
jgi:hypothetical protein